MTNQNKVNMFHFSGELFRALSLKMKVLITIVFSSLLVMSVVFLSFSDNFKHQVLDTSINYPWESETQGDRLIGGLLTEGFNESSCLSRYHKSFLYRKPSPYKPSEYLVSKLRSYEMLHKRCGPETQAYKEATNNLSDDFESNYANKSSEECKYVVWLADYGLGNRMLTLASVFLYALLTERIILIDQSKDVSDLFCEPFPGTSWLLPRDFPLMNKTYGYNKGYSRCYGKMVEDQTINSSSIPRHLYLHMLHDSRETDKLFVCQKYQRLIDKVPWLIFRANVYFVPSLWFNPAFNTELTKLFPQKETIFHHLARYLFHPTNRVWDIITSYYNDHLSKADERLGIQIRVFSSNAGYLQYVMDQVISCTTREKLLPELDPQAESKVNVSKKPKLKAVLVTSLYPEYSEKLRNMTLELPSSTRDVIQVYQPSGERYQQTDKAFHDQKALAEMYLLSLTDNIVASARSTFGYVAYSIGGLKPWLLYMPANHSAPDPPCVRATSTEPCFLTPLAHGCGAEWSWRTLPFVRQCEDIYGLKLFDEL